MGHKGKPVNGENNNDVAYMTEDGIPVERVAQQIMNIGLESAFQGASAGIHMISKGHGHQNGIHAKSTKGKSGSSSGRYALYLVRKPIEVTPEDLCKANISIEACVDNEQKVTIGSNDFVIRGAALPSQTLHIPASTLHASDASSSLEAGKVIGSIVISRAEFRSTDGIYEEGHDVPLDLLQNLPLRHIKKKVSRKGIKHLRQRLSANGVKRLSCSGSAAAQ